MERTQMDILPPAEMTLQRGDSSEVQGIVSPLFQRRMKQSIPGTVDVYGRSNGQASVVPEDWEVLALA